MPDYLDAQEDLQSLATITMAIKCGGKDVKRAPVSVSVGREAIQVFIDQSFTNITIDILGPVHGLQHGESSPGEFPWTCLILNQNNDFVGTCAVIPERSDNNLNSGTSKIITAAHNIKSTR